MPSTSPWLITEADARAREDALVRDFHRTALRLRVNDLPPAIGAVLLRRAGFPRDLVRAINAICERRLAEADHHG